jgi:hypothetical protein
MAQPSGFWRARKATKCKGAQDSYPSSSSLIRQKRGPGRPRARGRCLLGFSDRGTGGLGGPKDGVPRLRPVAGHISQAELPRPVALERSRARTGGTPQALHSARDVGTGSPVSWTSKTRIGIEGRELARCSIRLRDSALAPERGRLGGIPRHRASSRGGSLEMADRRRVVPKQAPCRGGH